MLDMNFREFLFHALRRIKDYGGALSRRCRPAECLASVVENRQVELPQAHGVGEYVDFDDLAARDREAHYRTRPSTLEHDVRVEHRDERFKVPVSCGSEEGVYDFSLASEIGVRNIGRSLHAAACAAR